MDLDGPTGRVRPLKTWDEYKHIWSPLCGLSYPPAPPTSNSVSLTLAFNSVQRLPTVVIEIKLDAIADPAKMEGRFYKNRNKI